MIVEQELIAIYMFIKEISVQYKLLDSTLYGFDNYYTNYLKLRLQIQKNMS